MRDSTDTKEVKKPNRWFAPLVQITVPAVIVLLATYVFEQVKAGSFPWWPYPAFTLLTGAIFIAHLFIDREEDEDARVSVEADIKAGSQNLGKIDGYH